MSSIYNAFDKNHIIEENDLINLFRKNPELKFINEKVKQNDLDKVVINEINEFFRENLTYLRNKKKTFF